MAPRRPVAGEDWPAAPASRPRARRSLTEADRALWHLYTARAQVAPLPGKALTPPAPAVAPLPAPQPVAVPAPAPAPKPVPHRPVELQVGAQPAGLDGKRWKSLRRGETRPERTLDLHGRRAQDAHAAVRRFLHQAQSEGCRCVAIVTGKGSVGQEMGVLRRELPHWLNAPDMRPLILGAAHYAAGNPGAVVLLLRRLRGPRE
ncbi:Smr/MutS family protein [Paracraurococcus lichenis]|uniref:Smr/MutS family protein n=1 Tax=Paracraurococcus lichenis TaxID=3064888 RepID=A0ABT9E353_9PROT|nr:Smr/MutS family protein [Paracraurococcus sp. LOR1-02]MDO9710591.1 Smr/MutS family protein [Paracraurococcus sp. LOR1-02]